MTTGAWNCGRLPDGARIISATDTAGLSEEFPEQLLDGSQFARMREPGQWGVCGEWDATAVVVPLARWNTLLAYLRTPSIDAATLNRTEGEKEEGNG